MIPSLLTQQYRNRNVMEYSYANNCHFTGPFTQQHYMISHQNVRIYSHWKHADRQKWIRLGCCLWLQPVLCIYTQQETENVGKREKMFNVFFLPFPFSGILRCWADKDDALELPLLLFVVVMWSHVWYRVDFHLVDVDHNSTVCILPTIVYAFLYNEIRTLSTQDWLCS